MSEDDYIEEFSIIQTGGAVFVCVVSFFIFIYVVAPIAEEVLNIFGRFFIPSRMGGGDEVNNPGLISMLIRAFLVSSFSAIGAFGISSWLFPNLQKKYVAVIFSVCILIWGVVITYFLFPVTGPVKSIMVFSLSSGPPLLVAYWEYRGYY